MSFLELTDAGKFTAEHFSVKDKKDEMPSHPHSLSHAANKTNWCCV